MGCGGNVVFVEDGAGGAGGATNAGTTNTSTSTSVGGVGGGGPGLVEEVVGVGVTDGPFAVETTAQTLGLHAVARSRVELGAVTFDSLMAPSGAYVTAGALPNNGWEWSGFGAVAMLAPQVEHAETFPSLAPGAWTFGFHSPAAADVSVWRRSTSDGAFHGGVLDVNFFIVGDVVDPDYATEVAAKAYSGWGGIELGDVRFFPLGEQYYAVDDQNLIDLAKETRAAETRPALNILAVGEITGSLEGASGFALGIPGAPLDHGSQVSGVVWMVNHGDYDPIILRHEGGHFGGLFHTSEFQAGLGDALSDTPMCLDANALGPMCPDYDLIMFPTGGSGLGLLSAQESRVLQASSLYRGVYSTGEAPMVAYGPAESAGANAEFAAPTMASDAMLAAMRANATLPRAHTPGAWSSSLAPNVTARLEGVGCPLGGGRGYFDALEDAGAIDADSMLDLARDASAPPYVRRRAAVHAAHLAADALADPAIVGGALGALAADTRAPTVVRSGALRALVELDPTVARSLSAALGRDADTRVRRLAAAIGN